MGSSVSSQVPKTCTIEYPTGTQHTLNINVKDTNMIYTPGDYILKTDITTKSQIYNVVSIISQQFNVNGTLTYTVNNQKHTEALTPNNFVAGYNDTELYVYLFTNTNTNVPVTLNISLLTANITYEIKPPQKVCTSS